MTDERGDKMSKVKGNVIDPLEVIYGGARCADFPEGMPSIGTDALRMTLLSYSPQGHKIALSLKRVEGYRHFCNKIWNAARFALPLLGDHAPAAAPGLPEPTALPDRWILSRLAATIDEVTRGLDEFRLDASVAAIYQFFWSELCDWYLEVAKPRLYAESDEAQAVAAKQSAQAILCDALDTSLRLLHPLAPFITEEIWQKLPRRPGDAVALIAATFPDAAWARRDVPAEEDFAALQAAISGIRTVRAEHDLSPATPLDVTVRPATPHIAAVLESHRDLVAQLCKTRGLAISIAAERPRGAAVVAAGGLEVLVPLKGLVDPAKERARLERDLVKVRKDIQSVERKLGNAAFVDKAPPAVVELERSRLADNRARLGVQLENALALVAELSE